MRFKVHVSSGKSDWEQLNPSEMNIYQMMAAHTGGLITPANFISLIGGILTIFGVFMLGSTTESTQQQGIFLILFGRFFDVIDGYVADWTKTKSPVGETIDASLDKLVLLVAMVQAFALEIAPFFILAAVLVQAIFNSSTSLVAKFYNISIHPTLSGKLSTMFAWFTLCTFAIHKLLTVGDPSDSTILAAGYLFFALFAGLGIVASINYFGQLRARS